MKHLTLYLGAASLSALVSACGSIPDGDGASQRSGATVRDFVDARGHRFRLRNEVAQQVEPPRDRSGRRLITTPAPDPRAAPAPQPTGVAELAEALRPLTVRDGHEYIGDPDLELARRVRDGVEARGWRASTGSAPTDPNAGEWPGRPAASAPIWSQIQIGSTDTRSVVRDNASYPWRALLWNSRGCSGTLIGASTMITAAHCLHNGINAWFPSTTFYPGVDAGDPVGSQYPYPGESCYDVAMPVAFINGVSGGDYRYDYAVVEFGERCHRYPGNTVGWFGWGSYSNATLTSGTSYTYGYPYDFCPNRTPCSPYPQIWGMGGAVSLNSSYPTQILYNMDTAGGQSGSSIYRIEDGVRRVVGVHRGGSNFSSSYNWGRRVDSTVVDFIRANSAL